MPVTMPRQRIDKTRAFGDDAVEIILLGDYFVQTLSAAQDNCANLGAYFLSPFDDPKVIKGQASVAVEIIEQLGAAPDFVVLPVGGGGLASGVTGYLRALRCPPSPTTLQCADRLPKAEVRDWREA